MWFLIFVFVLRIEPAYELECFSCVDVQDKTGKTIDISAYVHWLLQTSYSPFCFDFPNDTIHCKEDDQICATMIIRGIQSRNHTLPANNEYLYWLELYDIDTAIVRGCSNDIMKVEKQFIPHPDLKKWQQCIKNDHGSGHMLQCSCNDELCNISSGASRTRSMTIAFTFGFLLMILCR